MKVIAIKDGNGNVIMSEDSFATILLHLDNQKEIFETKRRGLRSGIQQAIDEYKKECKKILLQKYILYTAADGYLLQKKYEYQELNTAWSNDDYHRVCKLFENTERKKKNYKKLRPVTEDDVIKEGTNPIGINEEGWVVCEEEPEPWLIERKLSYDYYSLTISEDGLNNRRWKEEEIEKINKLLNNDTDTK
jgi:hypothetical protein